MLVGTIKNETDFYSGFSNNVCCGHHRRLEDKKNMSRTEQ